MTVYQLPAKSELLDSPPPTAREAELGVICSILLEPEIIPQVAKVIREYDFHGYDTRRAYTLSRWLYRTTGNVDSKALLEALQKNDSAPFGWQKFVESIIEVMPHSQDWRRFADAVRRAAHARWMIGTLLDAVRALYHGANPQTVSVKLDRLLTRERKR